MAEGSDAARRLLEMRSPQQDDKLTGADGEEKLDELAKARRRRQLKAEKQRQSHPHYDRDEHGNKIKWNVARRTTEAEKAARKLKEEQEDLDLEAELAEERYRQANPPKATWFKSPMEDSTKLGKPAEADKDVTSADWASPPINLGDLKTIFKENGDDYGVRLTDFVAEKMRDERLDVLRRLEREDGDDDDDDDDDDDQAAKPPPPPLRGPSPTTPVPSRAELLEAQRRRLQQSAVSPCDCPSGPTCPATYSTATLLPSDLMTSLGESAFQSRAGIGMLVNPTTPSQFVLVACTDSNMAVSATAAYRHKATSRTGEFFLFRPSAHPNLTTSRLCPSFHLKASSQSAPTKREA